MKRCGKKVLFDPGNVVEVNEKRSLRFLLKTAADFTAFSKAMEQYLPNVEFLDKADLDQPPDQQ
jgi:hypothetical protein